MTMRSEWDHKWSMAVDIDKCTGCQACVIACQSENNVPLNTEGLFNQSRAMSWIRIDRYWEGEFPNVKARFLPVMCQHCGSAPCEPVCPVYATYHNNQGMNVQIYNRCIGTRYCANNCPYEVRMFNYWQPVWPESLRNQLNPDVSIRTRGVMEKCSFCVQRIRRAERVAIQENRDLVEGEFTTACVQACPTGTLVFGDVNDPDSKVAELAHDRRQYRLLEGIGTEPNVIYLKKVDPDYENVGANEH